MIKTEYYKAIRRDPYIVAYWRLNDLSGTRAIDWSGKFGLNGIYDGSLENGTPLIFDDLGAGSKIFGSSGSNIEVPNATPFRLIGDMSIEFWAVSKAEKPSAAILNKMNSISEPKKAAPYNLSFSSGQILFQLGNGATQTSLNTTSEIPSNVPFHVVATSFRKTMVIFINGIESATKSLGAQEVKDLEKSIYIGALSNNTERFNGLLGEIAVYNGGFSVRKAKEHFAIGRRILYNKPYYTNYDPPIYA